MENTSEDIKARCARAMIRRFGASLLPYRFSRNKQFPSIVRATDDETGNWAEFSITQSGRIVRWNDSENAKRADDFSCGGLSDL